jgi:hypothetical protein
MKATVLTPFGNRYCGFFFLEVEKADKAKINVEKLRFSRGNPFHSLFSIA